MIAALIVVTVIIVIIVQGHPLVVADKWGQHYGQFS